MSVGFLIAVGFVKTRVFFGSLVLLHAVLCACLSCIKSVECVRAFAVIGDHEGYPNDMDIMFTST